MNYLGISHEDVLNGEGVRTVLWLSGCSHRCPGCHNPETWDENAGQVFDEKAKEEIYAELKKPWSDGLTLSGGDPLYYKNLKSLLEFLTQLKTEFPDKTIWIYSGYTFEQIFTSPIPIMLLRQKVVELCDVFIDGPYQKELRDISLAWRGSSNQRVIDIKKSLLKGKVILYE